MRKSFLLILSLLSVVVYAQGHFKLTPDGFKTIDNKDFLVVDVTEESASSIYKMLETGLISVFPSAHNNIDKERNSRFSITSVAYDLFRVNAGIGLQYIMDIEFHVVIDIKDGKYRILAPSISHIGTLANYRISRMIVYGDPKLYKNYHKNQFIFNYKNRTVQNNSAKMAIENYINSIVNKIININITNEDW